MKSPSKTRAARRIWFWVLVLLVAMSVLLAGCSPLDDFLPGDTVSSLGGATAGLTLDRSSITLRPEPETAMVGYEARYEFENPGASQYVEFEFVASMVRGGLRDIEVQLDGRALALISEDRASFPDWWANWGTLTEYPGFPLTQQRRDFDGDAQYHRFGAEISTGPHRLTLRYRMKPPQVMATDIYWGMAFITQTMGQTPWSDAEEREIIIDVPQGWDVVGTGTSEMHSNIATFRFEPTPDNLQAFVISPMPPSAQQFSIAYWSVFYVLFTVFLIAIWSGWWLQAWAARRGWSKWRWRLVSLGIGTAWTVAQAYVFVCVYGHAISSVVLRGWTHRGSSIAPDLFAGLMAALLTGFASTLGRIAWLSVRAFKKAARSSSLE